MDLVHDADDWADALRGPTIFEIVAEREPRSRGWLRRPEYDRDGLMAWEKPDGTLCVIRTGETD